MISIARLRSVCILIAVLVSAVGSLPARAHDLISFNGTDYRIGDNVILLDREDIYCNPLSVKNPAEAFSRINNSGKSATLLVAPSVYWLDDPDDPDIRTDKGGIPYAVRLKCDTLRIIGLSSNPEDVVFAVNRGQTQGAIGNFTMFHFDGNSLETGNITFGNYCNTDLIYPRNTEYNRLRRKQAIVQAQIGICQNTDRMFAYNCRFISRLNLCPFVGARRSLYDNCYFECTDDALSGSAIYKDCKFTFFSSKPFYSTAETGAIFMNCDIKSLCNGPQYFTKIPGMVTAIDTRFTADNPVRLQWTRDASDITSYQHNITLNGHRCEIDTDRPQLGPDLKTSRLKDAFLIEEDGKVLYNLPNLLGGNDGWDPLGYAPAISAAEKRLDKKLTGLPVTLRLKTDKSTLEANGDTARIAATPLLWGGYPADAPSSFSFISNNKLPIERDTILEFSLAEGLSGRLAVKTKPLLREAPQLKKKPSVRFDKTSGKYLVDYRLSGEGDDRSVITWQRLMKTGPDQYKALPIQYSTADTDCSYTPKAADIGESIIAIVLPEYSDSEAGSPLATSPCKVSGKIPVADKPESSLNTDFRNVPIVENAPGLTGIWTFDIYKPSDTAHVDWQAGNGAGWKYGKGFDASVSDGIFQTEKGARLSYVPARDGCSDMHVRLVAEPAKSGGQGFGSATTQYMDICVKFNPETLNGYALRIERTPEHDRAVQFSLVRYENGTTDVIEKGVASNCFRTPCTIDVSVSDGILRATASTQAADAAPCCDKVVDSVDIFATVENNPFAGFCIQHTGSTGASSTLISDININWE